MNKLNVIVGNRTERLPFLFSEFERQGITNYQLWDGIFLPSVVTSINAAHKQIVMDAKEKGLEEVIIAEDDFVGTHENSYKFFLENKPSKYSLYLSMIYLGEVDENKQTSRFTGLTLYSVHHSFYDTFLCTDANEHLDVALTNLGKYDVCYPFAFIQRNGYSSNSRQVENYDCLLNGRDLFLG